MILYSKYYCFSFSSNSSIILFKSQVLLIYSILAASGCHEYHEHSEHIQSIILPTMVIHVAHACVKVRHCISKQGHRRNRQKQFDYSSITYTNIHLYRCYVNKFLIEYYIFNCMFSYNKSLPAEICPYGSLLDIH